MPDDSSWPWLSLWEERPSWESVSEKPAVVFAGPRLLQKSTEINHSAIITHTHTRVCNYLRSLWGADSPKRDWWLLFKDFHFCFHSFMFLYLKMCFLHCFNVFVVISHLQDSTYAWIISRTFIFSVLLSLTTEMLDRGWGAAQVRTDRYHTDQDGSVGWMRAVYQKLLPWSLI